MLLNLLKLMADNCILYRLATLTRVTDDKIGVIVVALM